MRGRTGSGLGGGGLVGRETAVILFFKYGNIKNMPISTSAGSILHSETGGLSSAGCFGSCQER